MRVKLGNRELIVEIRKIPEVPERRHDIPLLFKCHKCGGMAPTELKDISETMIGSHYVVCCPHCTSLRKGSERATVNMISIEKEMFENGKPSQRPPLMAQ